LGLASGLALAVRPGVKGADLLSPTGVGGWAETELGLNLADERRRVVTLVEDMSSFWE
jgi:hypothetical protein